jgi:anhydro-N-acetylmuramic acid kinase
MTALFIGLMSGTSMDGVDGVLADFSAAGNPGVLVHRHRPYEAALRAELLRLNQPGDNELHRAALAANAVARCYAAVVRDLLDAAPDAAGTVSAIGAHGQTVRHRPQQFDGRGYTSQLLNGALLAELSHLDVVCDLRSRDVAAGGQGAPLVPAFHAARFGSAGMHVAVLNLGGIANLTLLPGDGRPVTGFDCGPGNVLLDLWCEQHLGASLDDGGRWAAGGRVDAALLARLLDEPFFRQPPPKSSGRDLFHRAWLDAKLAGLRSAIPAQDVQATLAELTVAAAVAALAQPGAATRQLHVCGGGAFNDHLMARLRAQLPGVAVSTTASAGVPPDQVEALAFAWLAHAFVHRQPGNLAAVTGAAGPRVLGALYPAG